MYQVLEHNFAIQLNFFHRYLTKYSNFNKFLSLTLLYNWTVHSFFWQNIQNLTSFELNFATQLNFFTGIWPNIQNVSIFWAQLCYTIGLFHRNFTKYSKCTNFLGLTLLYNWSFSQVFYQIFKIYQYSGLNSAIQLIFFTGILPNIQNVSIFWA